MNIYTFISLMNVSLPQLREFLAWAEGEFAFCSPAHYWGPVWSQWGAMDGEAREYALSRMGEGGKWMLRALNLISGFYAMDRFNAAQALSGLLDRAGDHHYTRGLLVVELLEVMLEEGDSVLDFELEDGSTLRESEGFARCLLHDDEETWVEYPDMLEALKGAIEINDGPILQYILRAFRSALLTIGGTEEEQRRHFIEFTENLHQFGRGQEGVLREIEKILRDHCLPHFYE